MASTLETFASRDKDLVADGVDRQLDPRYVTLRRQVGWIEIVVFAIVCAGVAAIFVVNPDLSLNTSRVSKGIMIAVACAILVRGWWAQKRPALTYTYSAYRVDGNGVEIRRGIFWREIINVPRSRVQHTDVSQGPFERRHGLGTLVIHTAGAHHAIVSLHGLAHETALKIRDNLLPRGTVDVV